jgi:uncharacterized protein (DUF58 family)
VWLQRSWLGGAAVLLLIGLATSSGPVIGLAAFLILAELTARLWSAHVFDRVRYERRLVETRAFAGERLLMTLQLTNDKVLPVPLLELRDLVPEHLVIGEEHLGPSPSPGQLYLRRSTHLGWYERVDWPLELEAQARGFYRFGPSRLGSGDLFGLFPAEQENDDRQAVIIYPRTYSLPELGLPAERPFGDRRGREPIFEDPGRIVGLRDYRPGDSMRRVDWKATARRQQLQSRVYDPSATLHLIVALNVHTLSASWEGYLPEKLEGLLSVAGSVARHGFEAGYAVGLAANGAYPTSDRPMRIPVGRRPDQLMRILEALAVIGPLTLTPLSAVLDREAQAFPFGATLVCVTMQMDAALAATLRRIEGAGHAVSILSLADDGLGADLGRLPVYELSDTVRELQAAGRTGALA